MTRALKQRCVLEHMSIEHHSGHSLAKEYAGDPWVVEGRIDPGGSECQQKATFLNSGFPVKPGSPSCDC
eukprot:1161034-Pelagomonas_calceolata.AAC.1